MLLLKDKEKTVIATKRFHRFYRNFGSDALVSAQNVKQVRYFNVQNRVDRFKMVAI